MFVCRYVQSWIDKREVQSEKANLTILFERYVPVILEANRVGRFKKITPIQEVRNCLYLLGGWGWGWGEGEELPLTK